MSLTLFCYYIIPGYFEKRVMEYRDEMQLTSPLHDMKVFGKKIVDFIRDKG